MRLGISSYTYTWAIGIPGYIPVSPLGYSGLHKRATELEVDTIQIADNLPLHHLSETEIIIYRDKCFKDGIQLEVGARGMTESSLDEYIKIASLVQSPLLRFVVDNQEFSPDLDTIIAIIQNHLPILKENNITLALENYERFKARDFASIIEKVGSSQVGICLDTVNSFGAGENVDTIVQILGPLTVNLHIKEFTIKRAFHKMGFHVEGVPAGNGMLNIPLLIKQVSKNCRSAIIEQWVPPEDNILKTIEKENEWAKQSVTYLKSIF